MANILIYGDSNTHGTVPLRELGQSTRYPAGQRWTDILARQLGPGHTVVAEGLPGRTSVHHDPVDGGNRNGLDVLPAVLGSHVPLDLVVVMLGTNDLKPRFPGTAFEIARGVERVVGAAQALLPEGLIVLVCPAPVRAAGVLVDAFEGAEARQAGLEDQMRAAAARAGVPFVAAGDHVAVSDIDGVHWEAEAHAAFGAAMADILGGLLAERGLSEGEKAVAKAANALPAPDPDAPEPLITATRAVPPHWADYNGHMNESHFLTVFSDACDQLLHWAGMDADCVAEGYSVFTVETHIRHLAEVDLGDHMEVRCRVIEGGGKKLHIWQEIWVGERLCATGEQLLLHVDLGLRRPAPPRADVGGWFARVKAAQAHLPVPDGFGRHVGQPRQAVNAPDHARS